MTFTLNDDQRMLKETARDFFREQAPVTRLRKQRDEKKNGRDPDLWREIAGLGLAGVIIPEEYGGAGLGFVALGAVLEESGRTLVVSPLHSSALAILKMIASVGMCSPRSTLPMCERSMPARCASDSCAMPRSVRNARTAAPKACASSASKVVAPAGRPGWTERFCMDRSVKSQDN